MPRRSPTGLAVCTTFFLAASAGNNGSSGPPSQPGPPPSAPFVTVFNATSVGFDRVLFSGPGDQVQ